MADWVAWRAWAYVSSVLRAIFRRTRLGTTLIWSIGWAMLALHVNIPPCSLNTDSLNGTRFRRNRCDILHMYNESDTIVANWWHQCPACGPEKMPTRKNKNNRKQKPEQPTSNEKKLDENARSSIWWFKISTSISLSLFSDIISHRKYFASAQMKWKFFSCLFFEIVSFADDFYSPNIVPHDASGERIHLALVCHLICKIKIICHDNERINPFPFASHFYFE